MRNPKSFRVLGVLFVLASGLTPTMALASNTVSGVVKSSTGKLIANATVTILDDDEKIDAEVMAKTSTDSAGKFSVTYERRLWDLAPKTLTTDNRVFAAHAPKSKPIGCPAPSVEAGGYVWEQ